MSCFKFSFIGSFLLCLLAAKAEVTKFTPKECLMAEYQTAVSHKGNFWGLMKSDLIVKKDVCQIVVIDKGVMDSEWKIDVCREPIHIKALSKGSLTVHRRTGSCETTNAKAGEFCEQWGLLQTALEDKGLIFAEGEREKLSTAHGKIYCSYLLLKKYLGKGVLFSKYQEPVDIYDKSSIDAPSSKASEPAKEKTGPAETSAEEESVEAQGRF